MHEPRTGTIQKIHGAPTSGLWTITFHDGAVVHIESGHGMRQLVAATDGHPLGVEVEYGVDDLGLLLWLRPTRNREL
jgi:hypothetical protein